MKAFLLLCLVGIVGAFDSKLDSTWNFWKAQFNRVYTEEEELYRRELWENTVAFIAQHNLEADLGLHTYEVGLNQFADWTDEEYQMLLGYRSPDQLNTTDIEAETYEAPENEPLPNAIDWRQRGAVTGIKNQGSCGSCWAFSSTGALEGQNFKKTGRLPNLSEQQLVDCTAAYGNKGCQGGWMNPSFTYVQRNGGINTQACYPYTGRQGSCHPNPAATCKGGTSAGFANVGRSDAALQSALGTVGPISVAIDAGKPGFKNYRSGIYNDPTCSKSQLNHAVLAVGFQPSYYIVKNSWGTSWGAAGYINMATNVNICGIVNSASYPRV